MGIDTIDLWQVHRPDILTHPHEVAGTVSRAIAGGKIRAFGVSNYTSTQIAALAECLTSPMVSTQPELSALCLDPLTNGESDQAIALDLAVLAWSPLAGGRLLEPGDARAQAVASALDAVAEEQGVTRSAAALAWLIAHPSRPIPIIGSQNAERIGQAADAIKVRWTRQSWYAVLTAARQEPLP
jgi:predicted oxidoreductase